MPKASEIFSEWDKIKNSYDARKQEPLLSNHKYHTTHGFRVELSVLEYHCHHLVEMRLLYNTTEGEKQSVQRAYCNLLDRWGRQEFKVPDLVVDDTSTTTLMTNFCLYEMLRQLGFDKIPDFAPHHMYYKDLLAKYTESLDHSAVSLVAKQVHQFESESAQDLTNNSLRLLEQVGIKADSAPMLHVLDSFESEEFTAMYKEAVNMLKAHSFSETKFVERNFDSGGVFTRFFTQTKTMPKTTVEVKLYDGNTIGKNILYHNLYVGCHNHISKSTLVFFTVAGLAESGSITIFETKHHKVLFQGRCNTDTSNIKYFDDPKSKDMIYFNIEKDFDCTKIGEHSTWNVKLAEAQIFSTRESVIGINNVDCRLEELSVIHGNKKYSIAIYKVFPESKVMQGLSIEESFFSLIDQSEEKYTEVRDISQEGRYLKLPCVYKNSLQYLQAQSDGHKLHELQSNESVALYYSDYNCHKLTVVLDPTNYCNIKYNHVKEYIDCKTTKIQKVKLGVSSGKKYAHIIREHGVEELCIINSTQSKTAPFYYDLIQEAAKIFDQRNPDHKIGEVMTVRPFGVYEFIQQTQGHAPKFPSAFEASLELEVSGDGGLLPLD